MSKITVQDLQHVLVDGVNFGAVADTIINNKDIASDVQLALVAWNDAQVAATKTSTEIAAKEASDALEKAVSELAALKSLSASLLDQARKIEHPEVQALVAEADKPENQRKKEALQAQIAELQKQADEIPA